MNKKQKQEKLNKYESGEDYRIKISHSDLEEIGILAQNRSIYMGSSLMDDQNKLNDDPDQVRIIDDEHLTQSRETSKFNT